MQIDISQILSSPAFTVLMTIVGTFLASKFPVIGPIIKQVLAALFPPPVPPQQAALEGLDKATLKAIGAGVTQDAVSERVRARCPHGCAFKPHDTAKS